MMSADPHKVKSVFLKAVEVCKRGDWQEFLNEACEGDVELRRRVEILLNAHMGEDSLFDEQSAEEFPTIDPPVKEEPGVTIGPYKLLQQIGEGGMGVVYMAEQSEPMERPVALKVIKLGMDTRQVIARFEAERQALAMMDHPNIAKVLEAGATDSGRPYFVMELVKGIPITEYCDQHELTPQERLKLFVPVCQAVQHAHQKGIIHRDVKPSNILVAEYDEVAVPKIIDFGVAKALNQRLTRKTLFTELGQVVGTLEYMSPEQAKLNQLDIDTRSDIYSLGVLLYELLAGVTPFDKQRLRSAAFDEMLRIVREEDPPRPSTRLSTVDTLPAIAAKRRTEPQKLGTLLRGDLDWIVMKALEKNRARRYPTATALADDVARYLRDEPVEATPPSLSYRWTKFARRNRIALLTGATIVSMVFIAIVSLATSLMRVTAESARARNAEAAAVSAREDTETQAYVASVAAADAAIRGHDTLLARRMLRVTPKRLRGWEWNYLASQLDLSVRTIEGHTSGIYDGAASPDGLRLTTVGADDGLRIWDLATEKQVLQVASAKGSPGQCIAFSPDGTTIAVAINDRDVALLDSQTGQERIKFVGAAMDSMGGTIRFSADGSRVLTSGARVQLYETETGKRVTTLGDVKVPCMGAALSDDGRLAATGSNDGFVRMYDVASGKLQWQSQENHGSVVGVCFSPNADLLAHGGNDRHVTLRRAEDGSIVRKLTGHAGAVTYVTFDDAGEMVASGSADRTGRIWSVSGDLLQILTGHTDVVGSVRFLHGDESLVSFSADKSIKIWKFEPPTPRLPTHNVVRWLAIRRDGDRGLRITFDEASWEPVEVALANPRTNETLARLDVAQNTAVKTSCFSNRGKWLIAGLSSGKIAIFDSDAGRLLKTLDLHAQAIESLALSPNGKRMAAVAGDGLIRQWDTSSWTSLPQVRLLNERLTAVSYSEKGSALLCGNSEGRVTIFDTERGAKPVVMEEDHCSVTDICLCENRGRLLVVGLDASVLPNTVARDGLRVTLWDTVSRRRVRQFRLDTTVVANLPPRLALHGRDRHTFTVTPVYSNRLPLFDLGSGRSLLSMDGGFWWAVTGASFVGDSFDELVAFDYYDTTKWWDAARGEKIATTFADASDESADEQGEK